ncbi:uncharacterized protein LOC141718888 [Apium graveolens]|uniref:uncharacterized protein LOC141718888 n=1 Tax=Apium graveolens TaxID=4045 RepID=UPI003D794885
MCIDFTYLNDACPKDCYPLSRIDTLIGATAGHEILSFMDGFSGYNQIKMHKYDTSKVSFMTDVEFREYCDDISIELRFTSVAHPQANGQAEVANKIILDGLKKRVKCSRNTWVDKLLPILWAYCTTCKVTTEATPFMLAYGAEAVVPLEITHGSPEIEAYEQETNEEGMRLTLDLIDEVRDEANTRHSLHVPST